MKPDHFFTQHLEPFGEPRTFPGGWDLSDLDASRPQASRAAKEAPSTVPPMPTQFAASPAAFLSHLADLL